MIAFVLLLNVAPALAGGDPPAEAGATYRETIVVTAERAKQSVRETTAAVTVLTRKDIERVPAGDLAELFGSVPGMHMFFARPFGGSPMLASRGFFGGGEVEYAQLLVDGVPVADAESGLANWRMIDVGEIDHVEILRGPGSAFYGDTALGGVVQVFTRHSEDPQNIVRLDAGSFGTWSGNVRAQLADFSFDGGLTRTSGYRHHSSNEEARGNVNVRRATSRGLWSASATINTRDQAEPGALTAEEMSTSRFSANGIFEGDREKSHRLRASASYETTAARVTVYGSRRTSDQTRTLLLVSGFGDRATRELETGTVGGSVQGTAGSFHWGVDAAHDRVESTYDTTTKADRQKLAGFVTHELDLSSRWRIASGIRFDSISDVDNAWSPRLALNFHDGPSSAFVQWSRAFKAPTLDQLFDARPFPDFAGGTFTISNPDLAPQRARNVEAGCAHRTTTTDLDVVAYQIDVDDEIDFDPVTFRYANIGATRHRGIETTMHFAKTSAIAPFLTYTFTRVTPSGEDVQLKNIPGHVVRAGVNVKGSLQIAATHLAGRFLDDANAFPLEDATIIDVRASRNIGRHRLILDLLNLSNERYSEIGFVLPDFEGTLIPHYFPAPGFAVRVGFEARF